MMVTAAEETPLLISLSGFSNQASSSFKFVITTLPRHGTLYQLLPNGSTTTLGNKIPFLQTTLTNGAGQLFYVVG
jgi:hypothetical protein